MVTSSLNVLGFYKVGLVVFPRSIQVHGEDGISCFISQLKTYIGRKNVFLLEVNMLRCDPQAAGHIVNSGQMM